MTSQENGGIIRNGYQILYAGNYYKGASKNSHFSKRNKIKKEKNRYTLPKYTYRVRKSFREFHGKSSSRPHDNAPPFSFRVQIALDFSYLDPEGQGRGTIMRA